MLGNPRQRAGENSRQIIVQGDYVEGITEERALEIATQVAERAVAEYSQDAQAVAEQRVNEFDEILVKRLTSADLLDAFRDPGFQVALKKAQLGAACSERDDDYELLSELLVERAQHGSDRPLRTGIQRAIEVIDSIDTDALRALTALRIVSTVQPLAGSVDAGLSTIAGCYQIVLDDGPLPLGRDWLDHLDILDAVRIDGSSTFKKSAEMFSRVVSGYVAAGVPAGSEHLNGDIALFGEDRLTVQCLPHELKEGFFRLPFVAPHHLTNALSHMAEMTDERQAAILRQADENFGLRADPDQELVAALWERAAGHDAIREMFAWWDQIPTYARSTVVGNVLARANGQRLDPAGRLVPDLGG